MNKRYISRCNNEWSIWIWFESSRIFRIFGIRIFFYNWDQQQFYIHFNCIIYFKFLLKAKLWHLSILDETQSQLQNLWQKYLRSITSISISQFVIIYTLFHKWWRCLEDLFYFLLILCKTDENKLIVCNIQ